MHAMEGLGCPPKPKTADLRREEGRSSEAHAPRAGLGSQARKGGW